MSDQRRRAEVKRYFTEVLKGDRAEFQRRARLTKGRVTQILEGGDAEAFGERAARNLARKLHLADDYFEARRLGEPPHTRLSPEQSELLRLWAPLLKDQREWFLGQLSIAHDNALRTIEEVTRRGFGSTATENALPAEFTRPAQRELLPQPIAKTGKKAKK